MVQVHCKCSGTHVIVLKGGKKWQRRIDFFTLMVNKTLQGWFGLPLSLLMSTKTCQPEKLPLENLSQTLTLSCTLPFILFTLYTLSRGPQTQPLLPQVHTVQLPHIRR